MLQLPKEGFNVSVGAHNTRLDALTEWLEGSIAFASDQFSYSDVVDALIEGNVYRDQNFAGERVVQAWEELRRRQKCLGPAAPYDVERQRLKRVAEWTATPAYSFCLALALQVPYRKLVSKKFGADYTEQGELFERLTAESLAKLGWHVHSTGWSRTAVKSIKDKVDQIAQHVGEPTLAGAVERWTKASAKDAGLDVVCSLPFGDGWGGRPLCLVQCASGEDWYRKLHTPSLARWGKLIDFTTSPSRGLSMPFAPLKEDFRHAALNDGLILLLDRHRLLAPSYRGDDDWLSADLAKSLNKWTGKRIKVFPLDDE